jgi:hypothetical protein
MVYGRFEEAGLKEALLSGSLPWAGFDIEIR